ncbi:MAG: YceI family protein, partial [Bacteroidetes bacterium]|nr:YceI family protein [Bacteroidota bacterium]
PKISFVSSSISKTSKGFSVTGKFTIKDVTKTVTIPFTFENQTFKGSLTIDRMDYHVGKNSWIMGDEVNIVFEIPVSKAS